MTSAGPEAFVGSTAPVAPSAGAAPSTGAAKGGARASRRSPFLAAGFFACLALAVAALVKLSHRAGEELAVFRVEPARTRTLQWPTWVPSEWEAQAREIAAARTQFSVFDDAAVDALRAEYEALPWVKSVSAVERKLPRTIQLAVTPRAPVALVEAGGERLLVDEQGCVLPRGTFDGTVISLLSRITRRNAFAEVPSPGQVWNDEGVADGISVALTLPRLAHYAPGIQIVEIDVTNSQGRIDPQETEVLLVTSNGVKIKWGRAPRTARFGELSPDVKFANLAEVARQFPGLAGVSCINLRFDQADVFDAAGQWIPRPLASR